MRFPIKLKLVLIFTVVILIPVTVITLVSMWINVNRMEKELQTASLKASENAMSMLAELMQTAKNIAQLLAETREIKEILTSLSLPNSGLETRESSRLQYILDDKHDMWFTSIVEIFDDEKHLLARSYAKGATAESFFTQSEDMILEKTLINLEKQIGYVVTPGGLSIKVSTPVINFETLKISGVIIVSYPFNVHLLQSLKERIQAEVTLHCLSDNKIISTLQDKKGGKITSIWENAASVNPKQLAKLGKGTFIQQQEHIGSHYYAATYTLLIHNDSECVGILITAINSAAIEQNKQDTLMLILISSLGIFILASFAGYLTALSFTRPICKLAAAIKLTTKGKLDKQLHLPQNDEIGDLARAFNDMTSALQQAYSELKDYNKMLEYKVMERTEALNQKNTMLNEMLAEVNEANKKIIDSIRYAEVIQNALLPDFDEIKRYIPDSFFIWMPRDIVGGDMIFIDFFLSPAKNISECVIVVADCTGHGVPGAFMTMIAFSSLKRIIKDENCHDPAHILKRLNGIVKTLLRQDRAKSLSDDGLDAAVIHVKFSDALSEGSQRDTLQSQDKRHHITDYSQQLTFAGARLPLYYVYNDEVTLIKGDKQSIGYKRSDPNYNFINHTIAVKKGISFYIATDGFVDQTGGEKGIAFGKTRFKNLLRDIHQMPFETRQNMLVKAFYDYKGSHKIHDDVTLLGFSL